MNFGPTQYLTEIILPFSRDTCCQFSSVTQSCPTLCDPVDCRTPSFPVHHQLPELTQTHAHQVSHAIQSPHPLSSPSPPAFNLSQHQGLFQWVSSLHQVARVLGVSASASVLPMNIQDWFPLGWTGWISLQSKRLSRVLWVRWMTLQFSAPGKECEFIAATSVWKFYQLNSIYNFSWTLMWGMSQVFSPETVYLYKRRYGLWEAWYTAVFSLGGLPFTTYMTCDKLPLER